MCNVFEVARDICEAGNWEVTNLQLQKMLYIAQVLYIGLHNDHHHLFRANFEAWDYGPVAPTVYHQFKIFGNKPIQKFAFPPVERQCSEEERQFINLIARALIRISPVNLVAMTHREGTGWAVRYEPGAKGVRITEEDMLNEYENVWRGNGEQ